jgi:catechol 2,3-dioxygenase-like lactoylglutathione lyase family enzyme
VPRFSHLFLFVSDLERSRRFYADLLGLEVLMKEPGYLRLGGGGGFHIGMEQGDPERVGAAGVELEIEVDDVDAEFTRLSAAGVDFEGPAADQPWGARHAWFTDPDGYRMSIWSS